MDQELTLQELVAGYNINAVARQRFQEASDMRKSAEGVVSQIRENPMQTLFQIFEMELGDSNKAHERLVNAALEYAKPVIEESGMEEPQRKVSQERRSLEWERNRLSREQNQAAAQRQASQEQANQEQLLAEINGAISELGLEKTYNPDIVVRRMVDTMVAYGQMNPGKVMVTADAAKSVKRDLQRETRALLGNLDADKAAKLNPKAVEDLRKKDIEAAKKKRKSNQRAASQVSNRNPKAKKRSKKRGPTTRQFYQELVNKQRD